jgi:CheY-like chemotaxis protein
MAKTLLLADDSVTIQKVVGISFANEDVSLITVDNGNDAISRAREVRPDAILADVVMPGKNGYEVCEAIKADPELQHIPVMLLTGTFEAYDEQRAMLVGASAHVSKPFEAQTLVDEVKRLFAQSASSGAAAAAAAAPAAPAAAPAATPAPVAEMADDITGDSFDFFDDEPGLTTDAARPDHTDPIESDALDIDAADDALSLDDSTPPLAGGAEGPAGVGFAERTMILPEAEGQPDRPSSAEQTIAIPVGEMLTPPSPKPVNLDDTDLPPLSPTAEPTVLSADFLAPDAATAPVEAQAPAAGADEITQDNPATPSGPETSFDSKLGDSLDLGPPARDGLDFDFESSLPASGEDAALKIDSAGLADETILDPSGASGFDVSSSDLGTTTPRPATAEPPPAPPAAAPTEEPWPAEPAAAPPPPAETEPPPAQIEPPVAPMPPAGTEPASAPTSAPRVASAPAGKSAAEGALSAIAPALREQLHDTLEKIAWESFSDVTEKIVQQAVEKVEAIAWEVIPQLAERLILEEIRRMKGESEDE